MAIANMSARKRVVVIGGGPTGLIAALLLATRGHDVALIAPAARPDPRTVALMQPSLQLLELIGLWPGKLQSQSAALKHLDIIDETDNIISAPRLTFSATELGIEAFGWNIPLAGLVPAALERLKQINVEYLETSVTDVELDPLVARVKLASDTSIECGLIIAADGAESTMRSAVGIETTSWSFAQRALVCNFAHTGEHFGVSTERHHVGGLCTTVPLPGQRSALVWMAKPETIELQAGSPEGLTTQIQLMTKGTLGKISDVTSPRTFPMGGLTANRFASNRVMLVGEAAHAMPPIGAQGLNMSMRDIGHALEVIETHDDPGGNAAMDDYHLRRVRDVTERQGAVSLVNQSLIADMLPLNVMRAGAFAAIAALPTLRQSVMRTGLFPDAVLPEIMKQATSASKHRQSQELSAH